jgi:hypothetical protein
MMMEPAPAALKAKLEPQERLLWWGRPKLGLMFRRADLFLVPFSLVWGGFAFSAGGGAISHGAPFPFILFTMLFMVVGFYIIVGRFLHDAWRRAGTCYGVTTRRILILSRSAMKSLELRQLSEVGLTESSDGSGSLAFGPELGLFQHNRGFGLWTGTPTTPTFERIANVGEVHSLIRRAQSDLERPA